MVEKTCNAQYELQERWFYMHKHNDLRDQTANMKSEVCKDTEIEPKLTPLSGERVQDKTSSNPIKERVDIRTQGFWE